MTAVPQRTRRASVWPYRLALIAVFGVAGGLVYTLAQALAEAGTDGHTADIGGVVGGLMLLVSGLMITVWCFLGGEQ